MVKSLLGKKIGMTQLFDESGTLVPVTVLQVGPCVVVQVKNGPDGACTAVQIGFDRRKRKSTPRPLLGHFDKAGVEPARVLREVEPEEGAELQPGQRRGFAGVMKRHGFRGGPATHGSKTHRRPGSIGPGTSPGRVIKGRRMAGHMGAARVTVRNLKVLRVDEARNLLLVKGAVPGANGSDVEVRKAKAHSANP